MTIEGLGILDAKIRKGSVPKLYKNIAPYYDIWAKFTEMKARTRSLELANIQNGEAVLEVAVGTGSAFAEIVKINPEGKNEGIDITEEMLMKAKEKVKSLGIDNYNLQLGDAYNLEYGDNCFDVLINSYMFDLLPEEDFPTVLLEFKRVLRPKGRLVLVNMTKGEHWYNALWEAIYRWNPAVVGGCRGVYLKAYLQSAGFTEIEREFVSQMTFPSEVISAVKP